MDKISQLKSFLESSPNDCFLKHALALEYIKSGDDDQAQLLFEENLRFDPDYIATYYHLGKLLERKQQDQEAIAIYSQGMERTKALGDQHAYSELRSVHDELFY